MKKLKPVVKIIIIAVIVVLILVLSLVFLLVLNKKVYDTDTVTTLLEKNNYVVTDRTSTYSKDKTIDSYIEAQDKKGTYKIEFYEMSSESAAKKYYNEVKTALEKETNGIKGQTDTNKMGFYKYTLEASGNYVVVIRSKNTIIYVNTNEKNKEVVNEIISKLKY